MLRNNIELDVKIKCIEQNKPFVQIMESLGYDVELTDVKREE